MSAPMTPTWARIIRDGIRAELARFHWGLPAVITSVGELVEHGQVSARPLLLAVYRDEDGNVDPREVPEIRRVTVAYPGGADWAIAIPLHVGNTVYLSFAERALDRWHEAQPGIPVDPELSRMCDFSDAIAIACVEPRIVPLALRHTENLRIGLRDASVMIEMTPDRKVSVIADEVELGGPGGERVARRGDPVKISNPAFIAWLTQVAAVAGPGPSGAPLPFTGGSFSEDITGTITDGSEIVSAT
jgi:hypothetical protein